MIVFFAVIAYAGLTVLVGSLLRAQSEALQLPLDDLALRRRQHELIAATAQVRRRARSLSAG